MECNGLDQGAPPLQPGLCKYIVGHTVSCKEMKKGSVPYAVVVVIVGMWNLSAGLLSFSSRSLRVRLLPLRMFLGTLLVVVVGVGRHPYELQSCSESSAVSRHASANNRIL